MEGGTNLRQGASGANLTIKVPFGTLVKDTESGHTLHDFTLDNSTWKACKGGKAGLGNDSFKTPTNQAPNICSLGHPGQKLTVELELKLIADIGLVGMPNAGKSTLMKSLTKADVKIGAYPFTTLVPNLGYIECEDYSQILIADIPGIIENAHQSKGLGLEFLKHIERTSALLFVVDTSGDERRDPFNDFLVLRNELGSYDLDMLERPYLVALNKADTPKSSEHIKDFRSQFRGNPEQLYVVSAKEQWGLDAFSESLRRFRQPKKLPVLEKKK
jgi:GTP-binding protein